MQPRKATDARKQESRSFSLKTDVSQWKSNCTESVWFCCSAENSDWRQTPRSFGEETKPLTSQAAMLPITSNLFTGWVMFGNSSPVWPLQKNCFILKPHCGILEFPLPRWAVFPNAIKRSSAAKFITINVFRNVLHHSPQLRHRDWFISNLPLSPFSRKWPCKAPTSQKALCLLQPQRRKHHDRWNLKLLSSFKVGWTNGSVIVSSNLNLHMSPKRLCSNSASKHCIHAWHWAKPNIQTGSGYPNMFSKRSLQHGFCSVSNSSCCF